MEDSINKDERRLAYLLRHDKTYQFDHYGWREVQDLLENHGFSMEELRTIVATSDKRRFEFSGDGKCIRACQGHSVDVDVELEEKIPPEYLYHGTVFSNTPSIFTQGLCRMARQYVHLSSDIETAMSVGGRRQGKIVVLRIMAQEMFNDGHRFWLSRNGVWLTNHVPPSYISLVHPVKLT